MSQHVVTVTVASSKQDFPLATTTSGIQVTLQNFPPVLVTAAPYVAVFNAVNAGATYSIVAQALDGTGAALGAAVNGSVTIPADGPTTVSLDVPASISVTVV